MARLPAFATLNDLADRGITVTVEDRARAQAALDDVSALIRHYGKDWIDDDGKLVDDLPDIVITVCCAAARRAIENPDSIRSETIGSYTETQDGDVIGGVALTDQEQALISAAAGDVAPGVFVLSTTRGRVETRSVRHIHDCVPVID